jgi:membrane associated rhomboid family serine protease
MAAPAGQEGSRWPPAPLATVAVFLITATTSSLQAVVTGLEPALRRDPAALSAGEWWRVVTPLVVQDGGLAGTVGNLASLAIVGTVAERLLGSRRWLVQYAVGGLAGEAAGYAWEPHGAGNSVAVCGLAGGLLALMLALGARTPRVVVPVAVWYTFAIAAVSVASGAAAAAPRRDRGAERALAVACLAAAAAITAIRNLHGVALLAGAGAGAPGAWRRRR